MERILPRTAINTAADSCIPNFQVNRHFIIQEK